RVLAETHVGIAGLAADRAIGVALAGLRLAGMDRREKARAAGAFGHLVGPGAGSRRSAIGGGAARRVVLQACDRGRAKAGGRVAGKVGVALSIRGACGAEPAHAFVLAQCDRRRLGAARAYRARGLHADAGIGIALVGIGALGETGARAGGDAGLIGAATVGIGDRAGNRRRSATRNQPQPDRIRIR